MPQKNSQALTKRTDQHVGDAVSEDARFAARRPELVSKAKEILHDRRAASPRIEGRWNREAITFGGAPGSLEEVVSGVVAEGSLGSRGDDAFSVMLGQLEHVTRQRGARRGVSACELNAGLAFTAAIGPQDELEGALAIQMAGTHALAVELLGRARGTDDAEHVALYGGMAVKLQRTFVAQVEALAKLRSAGKQTVEVVHVHRHENVTIMPGAQAVVAQGGGGVQLENGNQPHAHGLFRGQTAAGGSPMRGANPLGDALPGACDHGQEAMPPSRRP